MLRGDGIHGGHPQGRSPQGGLQNEKSSHLGRARKVEKEGRGSVEVPKRVYGFQLETML